MRLFAYLDHDNGIMSVYLLYICSNCTTEIYTTYILLHLCKIVKESTERICIVWGTTWKFHVAPFSVNPS